MADIDTSRIGSALKAVRIDKEWDNAYKDGRQGKLPIKTPKEIREEMDIAEVERVVKGHAERISRGRSVFNDIVTKAVRDGFSAIALGIDGIQAHKLSQANNIDFCTTGLTRREYIALEYVLADSAFLAEIDEKGYFITTKSYLEKHWFKPGRRIITNVILFKNV